jgi:hypothetical protein
LSSGVHQILPLKAFAFPENGRRDGEPAGIKRRLPSMSKLTWALVLTVLIAFFADQYFNQGHHTDGVIRTLSEIRRALGW